MYKTKIIISSNEQQNILITINFAMFLFKLINKLYCNKNAHIFIFYLYYDNIFIITHTVIANNNNVEPLMSSNFIITITRDLKNHKQ